MYNKVHDYLLVSKKRVLFLSYPISTLKTEFTEYVRLSESELIRIMGVLMYFVLWLICPGQNIFPLLPTWTTSRTHSHVLKFVSFDTERATWDFQRCSTRVFLRPRPRIVLKLSHEHWKRNTLKYWVDKLANFTR